MIPTSLANAERPRSVAEIRAGQYVRPRQRQPALASDSMTRWPGLSRRGTRGMGTLEMCVDDMPHAVGKHEDSTKFDYSLSIMRICHQEMAPTAGSIAVDKSVWISMAQPRRR